MDVPGTAFLKGSLAALNTCLCCCCMLQVIISVSQMLGNVIGLNNARFQESLSLINSYASSDKVMKGTGNYLQFCGTLWYRNELFDIVMVVIGDHGSTVVKVLCYKSEGRWFDPRWCHWNFLLTKSFRSHYGPGVDSASNRNEYQEHFLGVKAAGA